MNRFLLAAAVIILAPAWFTGGLVSAQEADRPNSYRGQAYAFFARGSGLQSSPLVGGGIGGELFVWKGFAGAADVSWYRETLASVYPTTGLATIGGTYHFVARSKLRGIDPFVTGGIGRFFEARACGPTCDNRAGISGQGGGGLTYWFYNHIGVRTELRFVGRDYGDDVAVSFGLESHSDR